MMSMRAKIHDPGTTTRARGFRFHACIISSLVPSLVGAFLISENKQESGNKAKTTEEISDHGVDEWVQQKEAEGEGWRKNNWVTFKDEVCKGHDVLTIEAAECKCPFGTGYIGEISWPDYSFTPNTPCALASTRKECEEFAAEKGSSSTSFGAAAGAAHQHTATGGSSVDWECEWVPFAYSQDDAPLKYGACVSHGPNHPKDEIAPGVILLGWCFVSGYVLHASGPYLWLRLLFRRTTRHLLNAVGVIGVLVPLLLYLVKPNAQEERPAAACASSYGMPSVHSSVATALMTLYLLQLAYATDRASVRIPGAFENGERRNKRAGGGDLERGGGDEVDNTMILPERRRHLGNETCLLQCAQNIYFQTTQLCKSLLSSFGKCCFYSDEYEYSHGEAVFWAGFLVLLWFPVGPCRVVLRDHSVSQTLVGSFIGCFFSIVWFQVTRALESWLLPWIGRTYLFGLFSHDLAPPFYKFRYAVKAEHVPEFERVKKLNLPEGHEKKIRLQQLHRLAAERIIRQLNFYRTNRELQHEMALSSAGNGRIGGDEEVLKRRAKVQEVIDLQQEVADVVGLNLKDVLFRIQKGTTGAQVGSAAAMLTGEGAGTRGSTVPAEQQYRARPSAAEAEQGGGAVNSDGFLVTAFAGGESGDVEGTTGGGNAVQQPLLASAKRSTNADARITTGIYPAGAGKTKTSVGGAGSSAA
ncbi:unnamed protein product [Amoebophrya sp. A120]|nr:unnamed protein product [Amoebophrya sp. A120]|eukprot:GSA120T00019399001.1